jgi:phosphate-selective porin
MFKIASALLVSCLALATAASAAPAAPAAEASAAPAARKAVDHRAEHLRLRRDCEAKAKLQGLSAAEVTPFVQRCLSGKP